MRLVGNLRVGYRVGLVDLMSSSPGQRSSSEPDLVCRLGAPNFWGVVQHRL